MRNRPLILALLALSVIAVIAIRRTAPAAETDAPAHPHGKFRGECGTCHGPDGWSPPRFADDWDHAEFGFPLEDAHKGLGCRSCHVSLDFTEQVSACVNCHIDIHEGEFGSACARCHSPHGFDDRTFFARAHLETRFPLTGAHATVDCDVCHSGTPEKGRAYVHTPTECVACHKTDYEGTDEPDHAAVGFPTDCSGCHTTATWDGAVFDHSSFPLTGGHSNATCTQCHAGGVYSGTPTDCGSCHQSEFEGTTDPNHAAAGFSTDCAGCHTTAGWEGATFDHSSFPLTEGHSEATCAQCHVGGVYSGTSTDCFACHQTDYEETTDPSHAAAGFPTDCSGCHTTASWDDAEFDHSSFPLTDGHSGVGCNQCHAGGVFEGTATVCYACHQSEFEGTTDPNHGAAGFSTDCAGCHTTAGWEGAAFDHSSFPLTEGHSEATCAQCHVGGVYSGTSTDCFACHQSDYEETTDPNHAAAGYPTDCLECHTTAGWDEADFDHSSFPLAGGHFGKSCKQCHATGGFEGTTTVCYVCHQSDYEETADPNHAAAGFSTTCTQCHTVTAWEDGVFDHSFFSLTDGHSGLACTECHVGEVYAGTSSDCYSCHQADYEGTTDPNHAAAGFPTACAECHTTTTWDGATFDHTSFPLTGGHSGVTCNQCHAGGVYEGTSTVCYVCHQSDYEGTADPSHAAAGFSTTCTQCHTVTAWENGVFDHTFFPLTGAHSALTCTECHVGEVYSGTSSDCYSCHQADYEGTTDPNHAAAGFPTACAECHTTTTWDGATFDHTSFPLTGGHSGVTCNQCHAGGVYEGTSTVCFVCHQSDYEGATDPSHAAAGFSTTCTQCHAVTAWDDGVFDHSFFPLTDGHAGATCEQCHAGDVYSGTSNDCYSCHQADYEGTTDPNHAAAGFPTDCSGCHTTAAWEGATFDHSSFPLTGGHSGVTCNQCHAGGVFEGTTNVCFVCHETDYEGTTDPNHAAAGFSTTCTQCHAVTAWDDGVFDHSFFPLTDGHAGATCEQCHAGDVYWGTSNDCYSCHQADYEGTTDPNHAAAGFPTDCSGCHTTAAWEGATFDHTSFPLTGGHSGVTCSQCHAGGVFEGTTNVCFVCHETDYEGTTDPDHAAAGFSTTCTQCHTVTAWEDGVFDHSFFSLTDGHSGLACTECHVGEVYAGTSSDCYSCHQADYEGTTDPNHAAAGFPTACAECHTTTTWDGATFDHTSFPLTGGHSGVTCNQCHAGGVYEGTSTVCYVCHQSDYEGTADPSHAAAGFSTTCTQCHTVTAWENGVFDHTFFPLTGAHSALTCTECHVGEVYSGTSSDCYSCHQADYEGTTDPNHAAAGFPTACAECHTTTTWDGATFDHTSFPLTGGHSGVTCNQCHAGGVYEGTSTVCYVCHQSDYEGTADPSHAAAGFSTTCTQCHTVTAWENGVFDHTFFPLTGAHSALTCTECHVGEVYSGTSSDCYSCHQADYEGTTDPNHAAAGFPTDCEACHTVTTWEGATFDHSSFPLTGGHSGMTCNQCHAGGVYEGTSTVCYVCHQSDYEGTADPSHAAAGFSTTCTQCHTVTVWENGVFDHSFFPLTGGHSGLTCTECHVGEVYAGTSSDCYACHQADYEGTTDPNHAAAGFPTDCAACHTITTWDDADFDHDGLFFPIYSGEHRDKWDACSDCHIDPNNYGNFSCLGCHPHSDRNETDNHHDEVSGYSYDSFACYGCHPDGDE